MFYSISYCRTDLKPPRMFLHAFRLILPNPVEPLDLRTEDPFERLDSFRETEIVHELNSEIFSIFEDENIKWTLKPS